MADKNFFAFRATPELAVAINKAVNDAGISKTEWITDAIMHKLGLISPEGRMQALISRLESTAGRMEKAVCYPSKMAGVVDICIEDVTEADGAGGSGDIGTLVRDLYLQGLSRQQIADALNERGMKTARSSVITYASVDGYISRMKRKGQL